MVKDFKLDIRNFMKGLLKDDVIKSSLGNPILIEYLIDYLK